MRSGQIFPIHLCSLAFLVILFSCRTAINSQEASLPEAGPGSSSSEDPILMPQVPLDPFHACYMGIKRRDAVYSFYKDRNGGPVWLNNEGKLNSLADSMLLFIKGINYYGLNPSGYHHDSLTRVPQSAEDLLKTEIHLTDAFLAISSDLRSGRQTEPGKISDSTGIVLLRNVVEGAGLKKSLETREPKFSGYRALKIALGNVLDSMLDCNQADSFRMLRQLQIIQFNLDRWRQEKALFAKRYVYINIPSFMLQVIENDTVVFSSRVIVGATETPTPEISSIIECFTIYPYWHVPRKIAIEEYLPAIKKDSTFIIRNNFDVLDRKGRILDADSIEWSTFHKNYFPVVLRQREGEENSLGVVKFLFDNPYAVYLHDTNAKRLFRSSRRAFSHGCMRMEKAVDLAHYLVTGELDTRSRMVDRYLKEKRRQTITLKMPIPIYSRYFTAEVIDGKFHLYDDLYNQEPEGITDRGSEARE